MDKSSNESIFPFFGKPVIEKWLSNNNKYRFSSNTVFTIKYVDNHSVVKVKGVAVFENFEIDKIMNDKGFGNVIIDEVIGNVTILNQLSRLEIYNRIKKYYERILDLCLGKSIQEQEDILIAKFQGVSSLLHQQIQNGQIEKTEKYIRSLPVFPTEQQMDDLFDQVLLGELSYGYESYQLDERGVKMNLYAKAGKA